MFPNGRNSVRLEYEPSGTEYDLVRGPSPRKIKKVDLQNKSCDFFGVKTVSENSLAFVFKIIDPVNCIFVDKN